MPFILNTFVLDVNSWLVTFGFHLHNAIPGFPVPKFDLTEPSYELVKSQQWDDIPVRNKRQHSGKGIKGFLRLASPVFHQTTRAETVPETVFHFFDSFRKENTTSLCISVQQTRGLLHRLKSGFSDASKHRGRHYHKVMEEAHF